MWREPSPHDVAGQAQVVEHLTVVLGDPSGQHTAFPTGRRDLVPLQLFQDLQQARTAVQLSTRRHVLPAGKKVDEVGGRHRLDLASQTAKRQSVYPSQDSPVAPLCLRSDRSAGGRELALKNLPLALQTGQRHLNGFNRKPQAVGQLGNGLRTGALEPSSQHFGHGVVLTRRHGLVDIACPGRPPVGIGHPSQKDSLGGHPELMVVDRQGDGAAVAGQLLVPRSPIGHGRMHAQGQERVVQLVGLAHNRCRLGRDVGNCQLVECAHLFGVARQRSPQLNGACATLLQGRVVEEGVRVGVENLVAQRRGLGGVHRSRHDGSLLEGREHFPQPVQVHGLVETVANRLLDQGMVGDSNLSDEVLLTGDLVGEHRRQQVIGPHPLQGRSHLSASSET